MPNAYVEIPAVEIEVTLATAGFGLEDRQGELVYTLRHARDPRLTVSVYTSVGKGAKAARGCGEDAIRVVARFTWEVKGDPKPRTKVLYRAKVLRVNSVTGTVERMVREAREGWKACNRWYTAAWEKKHGKVETTQGRTV